MKTSTDIIHKLGYYFYKVCYLSLTIEDKKKTFYNSTINYLISTMKSYPLKMNFKYNNDYDQIITNKLFFVYS